MEKKRSVGVTFFGIIFLLSALKGLISLNTSSISFALQLISVILQITWGIGALLLLEWGRKLIIYSATVTVAMNILLYNKFLKAYLTEAPSVAATHTSIILKLLLVGFIIYFFTRPKVKDQFKPGGPNA